MEPTLRDQQAQWREHNGRLNPASEGELLDPERDVGHLARRKRQRILGAFTFLQDVKDGPPVLLNPLLPNQPLGDIKVVGIVSTILGQEGLLSQGLWYKDRCFDWYWATITGLLKIEVREDRRFRGGIKCVWLTTAIAEYALTIPHPKYFDLRENTLMYFNAPRVDVAPLNDYRPHWWPEESAGLWPGKRLPEDGLRLVDRAEELRRLTEYLSVDCDSAANHVRQLGHYGDERFPGQPSHNLGQLQPWVLKFDGGRKAKRNQAENRPAESKEEEDLKEEGEILSESLGEKRKISTSGWRRTRWRRE